ncbi:hypothetical protein BO78DRAFT_124321 [Aspergillus sclerotiicarbonarius CBS 121057]|uniref:Uncharacterized protein n=1 Tax=Aspergillus sclerotiicarbonarius (strain CBS 121057 / IBT 28362) TaxID=1448318 RepID=A0A319E7R9_ASPSB|nr:hypothetical protein BO78DRAFT_124321 [Aspergillus sclerotiicarbonarius CBS 121057]
MPGDALPAQVKGRYSWRPSTGKGARRMLVINALPRMLWGSRVAEVQARLLALHNQEKRSQATQRNEQQSDSRWRFRNHPRPCQECDDNCILSGSGDLFIVAIADRLDACDHGEILGQASSESRRGKAGGILPVRSHSLSSVGIPLEPKEKERQRCVPARSRLQTAD